MHIRFDRSSCIEKTHLTAPQLFKPQFVGTISCGSPLEMTLLLTAVTQSIPLCQSHLRWEGREIVLRV